MGQSKQYIEFVTEVCKLSDCLKTDIKTRCRKREIVRARQIIITYRHLVLEMTQEKAASPFGMNHSSVPNMVRVIKNDYQTDENYRDMFAEIFEKYPVLINDSKHKKRSRRLIWDF